METKNISSTLHSYNACKEDGLDIEQMRSQLGILKQKLEKQTIVTDRLMQQAMKQKMSWIGRYMWFSALVLLPIVCIGWWQIKIMLGLSWWSYGLMVGLSAICVAADTLINKMKPDDWNNENLVQTSMKLAHMKHIRKVQVSIQAFLLLLVIIAVAYDAYQANVLPHDRLLILGISMIVGAVIGGAVGLYILARMQRTNDDIINEIEAFKGKKAER